MNHLRIALELAKPPVERHAIILGLGDHNGTTLNAEIWDGGSFVDVSDRDVTLIIRTKDGAVLEFPCDTSEGTAACVLDERQIGGRGVELAYLTIEDDERIFSTERFRIIAMEGEV